MAKQFYSLVSHDWISLEAIINDLSSRIITGFQAQGDVLDDLNTLGVNSADGEMIVGTGAGALAWESGATLRTSIGVYSKAEVNAAISAAVTAEDLDFAGDSGTGAVDLDSQTFTLATSNDSLVTSAASQTLTIALADVLEDIDTLGPPTTDGQFLVADGAGSFVYESGDTARTSLGLGTADSPAWVTADLTGITDGNIPYMSASGFADSPLSTDGTNLGFGVAPGTYGFHFSGSQYIDFRFTSSDAVGAGLTLNPSAAGGQEWRIIATANGAGAGGGRCAFFRPGGGYKTAFTTGAIWELYSDSAPGSSLADGIQIFSDDWNGAGTATPHFRNEEGHTFLWAQQAHIADANTSHAVTDFAETNSALDALAGKVNSLIATFETSGQRATS